MVENRLSKRHVMFAVLLLGALVQCGSPTTPTATEAVFHVRACFRSLHAPNGEIFRILLRDSERIAEARALVGAPVGSRRIVAGTVLTGNGGFNLPWNWHLAPDTVWFPQFTVEICDACPSFVEANIDQWRSATFCPWSSEIIAEHE
jgi:hypothetical protein